MGLVPKKVYESYFTVHVDGSRVGHDWIYWEPHGDRTAWFQRQPRYEAGEERVDKKVEARFRLSNDGIPGLLWLRYRDNVTGQTVEAVTDAAAAKPGVRVIPAGVGVLPSYLMDLVAAAAPAVPGEITRCSLLHESDCRIVPGYVLKCRGAEQIDVSGEMFETLRYELVREVAGAGEVRQGEAWVDRNRRIRKMDYGGPIALIATRDEALAGS
jgi:hypothetical protein